MNLGKEHMESLCTILIKFLKLKIVMKFLKSFKKSNYRIC